MVQGRGTRRSVETPGNRPRVRSAHVDRPDGLQTRFWGLNAKQVRRFASLDAVLENFHSAVSGRCWYGGSAETVISTHLPPPVMVDRTAVRQAVTHMLCCSCATCFSAAASSEKFQGSMHLTSNTAAVSTTLRS